MDIICRKDAQQQGLNTYFTGKPCKNGHTTKRFVDSGVCYGCIEVNARKYRTANRNVVNAKVKDWRRNNPDYYNQRYAVDSNRSRSWTKQWKANNPDKVALHADRRRDILKRATPPWFERELVQKVYQKRDELSSLWNVDLTVDHVIPLQGKTVCGLHCWLNLQIIERKENGRKRNKTSNC